MHGNALRIIGSAVAIGLVLGSVSPSQAAPPAGEKAAERLHEKAKNAYRDGRLREAVELWREANRLQAHWKYAYNLANAAYEIQDYLAAWEFVGRAKALGLPAEYIAQLAELRGKVRGALLNKHALLELTVEPPDATVRRNGHPWVPPRELWTTDRQSRIEVSRAGYDTATFVWDHVPGTPHTRAVRLDKSKPLVALTVIGRPVGATVLVDDRPSGRLPLRAPLRIRPGRHVLRVTHPGYVAETRTLDVRPGAGIQVSVALRAVGGGRADVGLRAEARRGALWTPGWATLASGLAVVAVGAGMFGWSDTITKDINDLQKSPGGLAKFGTYAGFRQHVTSESDKADKVALAGWVLTGVGAAATVGGVVMVILGRKGPSMGGATVGFVPLPGGGTVLGEVRF